METRDELIRLLSDDERRLLRGLLRGSLFDGAVPLILGDVVDRPRDTLAALSRRGLVRLNTLTWELTPTGEAVATELAEDDREAC